MNTLKNNEHERIEELRKLFRALEQGEQLQAYGADGNYRNIQPEEIFEQLGVFFGKFPGLSVSPKDTEFYTVEELLRLGIRWINKGKRHFHISYINEATNELSVDPRNNMTPRMAASCGYCWATDNGFWKSFKK